MGTSLSGWVSQKASLVLLTQYPSGPHKLVWSGGLQRLLWPQEPICLSSFFRPAGRGSSDRHRPGNMSTLKEKEARCFGTDPKITEINRRFSADLSRFGPPLKSP
ncbi:hypothetical protein llap_20567 [Limosa lapponica baueri]|uniref:Uncharacterized protein n=1 Tax=Limosa lapponica baueri TaxID=1758121 RepID=A0A2I0T5Q6_LIMLA|nr:hypothetical protein llap_20567 [Limosa lapponica baueri]